MHQSLSLHDEKSKLWLSFFIFVQSKRVLLDINQASTNNCQEFKVSIGWKIFGYLMLLLLIGITLIIYYFVLLDDSSGQIALSLSDWLVLCIPLIFNVFPLYLVFLFHRSVLVINDYTVTIDFGVFHKKREIAFSEIIGVRTNENGILLVPQGKAKKTILIGYYFNDINMILECLSAHVPNLDKMDEKTEMEEILENPDFGDTFDLRERNLVKAKRVVKILNIVGVGTSLWVVYTPNPDRIGICSLLIIVFTSIFLVKRFQGLIVLGLAKPKTIYPQLLVFYIVPCALVYRVAYDYQLLNYSNVVLQSFVVGITLTSIVFYKFSELSRLKKVSAYIALFLHFILFSVLGYSTIVILNCWLDKANPEIYNSKIIYKRNNSGKYLTLLPWEKQNDTAEYRVTNSLYKSVEIDSVVSIYVMPGRFNIPWLEVKRRKPIVR